MDADLEAIDRELGALKSRLDAVAQQLEDAARTAREGRLPGQPLAAELDAVGRQFSEAVRMVSAACANEGVQMDAASAPASVEEMRRLLGAAAQGRERRTAQRARAVNTLNRARRIRAAGDHDVLAEQVRRQATQLLRDLEVSGSLGADEELLATGTHPLAALVELIEHRAGTDERADLNRFVLVCRSLGEEIVWLLYRGKLRIEPEHGGSEPPEGPRRPVYPKARGSIERAVANTVLPGLAPAVPRVSPREQVLTLPGAAADARRADSKPPTAQPRGEGAVAAVPEQRSTARDVATHARAASPPEPSIEARLPVEQQAPPSSEPATDGPGRVEEAAAITAPQEPRKPEEIEQAIWRMLADNRPGLAYHISRYLDSPDLPPALMAWVALGSSAGRDTGEAARILAEHSTQVYETVGQLDARQDGTAQAISLLAFSSALVPALTAPDTGATEILRRVRLAGWPDGLENVRSAVLRFSDLGMPLSEDVLRGVRERTELDAILRDHQANCGRWLEQNRRGAIKYQGATKVLHRWLDPSEELGRALAWVAAGYVAHLAQMEETARRWSKDAEVDKAIDRTYARLRGRTGFTRSIEGEARNSLKQHAREAAWLIQEWVRMARRRENGGDDHVYRKAAECRDAAIAAIKAVRGCAEMQAQHRPADDLPRAAAKAECLKSLDALEAVFGLRRPDGPLAARYILHGELLRTDLSLGEDWSPTDTAEEVARAILSMDAGATWEIVFERRCTAGDHVATGRMLEYLESIACEGETVERLKTLRERSVREWRAKLADEREQTITLIEAAAVQDVTSDADRRDFLAVLEAAAPDAVEHFPKALAAMADVRGQLEVQRRRRADAIRGRVESVPDAEVRSRAVRRVDELLGRDEFVMADEYVTCIEEGREPPAEPDRPDLLAHFFPRFVSRAVEFLGERPLAGCIDDIRAARDVGPVAVSALTGAEAEEAARAIEAWVELKQSPAADQVGRVLEWLGMRSVQAQTKAQGGDAQEYRPKGCEFYSVKCVPMSSRLDAIIPDFGSEANGHYSVVHVRGPMSPTELIQVATAAARDAMPVVLYGKRLNPTERSQLADLCRKTRRSAVVVDDVLMFYLCGVRNPRWPVVMQLTLPFTVGDPYVTTASHVPTEMFYGRERERRQIVDPYGSSLMYGGRQLGKTALLRNIEDEMRRPEAGVVVRWLDLKERQIGTGRPVGEIWRLIRDVLVEDKVLEPGLSHPDTLRNRVGDWLGENGGRRILLLLDEADAFLDGDGREGWPNVKALSGLMTSTDRRFKVVFSGLHNVQRAARDPNNPLAHFGQPMCIGPMIGDRESRAAWELIEVPFGALGYRFDPPDLPLRILSYTNYYPSLIQLFCRELLEHVTYSYSSAGTSGLGPPYMITPKEIDQAIRNRHLREAIEDRFRLTLDLDPRYAAIALHVAARTLATGRHDNGFTVREIREMVLGGVCGDCFAERASVEDFRVVIDELEGLGVLRQVRGSDRYALRSPNVLNLFGKPEQIDDALMALSERPGPRPYHAETLRRCLDKASFWRSPLTFQQESRLLRPANGIGIIFGSALAPIESVPDALRACSADLGMPVVIEAIADTAGPDDLSRKLDDIWSSTTRSGEIAVVLVPSACAWDEQWIIRAADFISARRSQSRYLRVLLIADPKRAWSWFQNDSESRAVAEIVEQYELKPWAEPVLSQWVEELGLAASGGSDVGRIAAATGRWGMLVRELALRCADRPHEWKKHVAEMEERGAELVRSRLGSQIVPEAEPVLRALAQLDQPEDPAELLELVEGDVRTAEVSLRWAEAVGFAHCREPGRKVVIDPIVAKALVW